VRSFAAPWSGCSTRTADLLRATVDTVLHGAIHPARFGTDDEQFRAVIPTARDDEQEVDP